MQTHKNMWMLLAVIFAFAALASAQDTPKEQVKHVPIKTTSAASGPEMYKNYCAVCHGADGKGGGPAADALKVPATDLTMLAKKNNGKYPGFKVASVLKGDNQTAAHGSKEMPIWGDLFWNLSGGHDAEVQQRITNLNKYIESLQQK